MHDHLRQRRALLAEAGAPARPGWASLRTYTTRHGAGPARDRGPARWPLPEPHNATGPWQGAFRVGHFDAVAHRYAVEVAGGVDALALTHLDVAAPDGWLRIGRAYHFDGGRVERLAPGRAGDLDRQARLTRWLSRARPELHPVPAGAWPDLVAEVLGAPVRVVWGGPTASDKSTRNVLAIVGG